MNRDIPPQEPYNEGMNNEHRAGKHLGADFEKAAQEGDASALREVFGAAGAHELLERYSARMAAREFMIEQKGRLSMLDEEVAQLEEVEPAVRSYLDGMMRSYEETMVRPYEKDTDEKPQLERAADVMSDEQIAHIARHIMEVDARFLIDVPAIQEWMGQDIKNMIAESLWAIVQDEREGVPGVAVRARMHGAIARIVDSLNAKIPGSMLR